MTFRNFFKNSFIYACLQSSRALWANVHFLNQLHDHNGCLLVAIVHSGICAELTGFPTFKDVSPPSLAASFRLQKSTMTQHNLITNNKNVSDLGGPWRSQAKVKGRKKWTNGHMSQSTTLTDIIPGTKVQYNKRHLMT